MSSTEKLNKSKEYKEQGNNAFKQNNVEKACILYKKAVELISSEELDSEGKSHLVNCYLNIAACRLKTNHPEAVIKASTKALAIDPNNVKGLFRRGKAYSAVNELDKAKGDLTKVLELDKTNTDAKNELNLLRDKINASKKTEQKFYGGMFDKLDKSPSLYDKPAEQPGMKKCTICGEEMEEIQWARHVIKKHGTKQ